MYNIWGENQSSTDLSFCFLISCSRVKTKRARKSRTLHPPKSLFKKMTTAFSGLQTKLSLYNVLRKSSISSDLSFCLLTSCPRVKPCKRESTALHSPKRIPAIRLQSLLGDQNKAVYVNKRAAKRQHNRSTNEKKKKNNNNRDSATNAAISLMGKKENSNSPKKSFKKKKSCIKSTATTRSIQRENCNRLSHSAAEEEENATTKERSAREEEEQQTRRKCVYGTCMGLWLNHQRRVSIGNKVIYITETASPSG